MKNSTRSNFTPAAWTLGSSDYAGTDTKLTEKEETMCRQRLPHPGSEASSRVCLRPQEGTFQPVPGKWREHVPALPDARTCLTPRPNTRQRRPPVPLPPSAHTPGHAERSPEQRHAPGASAELSLRWPHHRGSLQHCRPASHPTRQEPRSQGPWCTARCEKRQLREQGNNVLPSGYTVITAPAKKKMRKLSSHTTLTEFKKYACL